MLSRAPPAVFTASATIYPIPSIILHEHPGKWLARHKKKSDDEKPDCDYRSNLFNLEPLFTMVPGNHSLEVTGRTWRPS